jgi:lipid II:glycine glycyltransferase (peptidoglycan interpeptide bridge formation enzyme)
LQSWAWGRFAESQSQKILRFSGENFICLGIETELSLGKRYLYCPRGPLGNFAEALTDLNKLADNRNLVFARVEPLQKVNLPKAVKDIQPVNEWMLDLTKTEEELLIGMKPKTRYNINLASRKGVTVREGEKKDLLTLWQLLLESANRNNIRLHPQNYYWQMWDYLAPDYLKILIAEYQGKPLAGMILTLFGDTATYLHGGTSAKMKEAMAPYVLHWEAIRLARQLGLKNYNFGGVAPEGEERHAWAGISRFKKGFGGFEVKYPGSFDLIFSPIWYNVYKNARKLLKGYR